MTGIERLRAIAGAWDEWGLGGALAEIADEIERERACDADTIENTRLIVGGVIDDMERHVSGHEGADDSPVARWARELREALGGEKCDPADFLPADEREAIAWVREHGGLGAVQARVDTLQGTLDWLRGRAGVSKSEIVDYDELLDSLDRRLMPEGMKWPTVDGRKVDFKTSYQPSLGVLEAVSIYNNGAVEVMSHDGIIKPVSEIHTVVLAADGLPLREGEHVYHVETGAELVVKGLPKPGEYQAVVVFALPTSPASHLTSFDPDQLTHTKPEPPDSWERIEEDATLSPEVYCHRNGIDISQKDGTEIFLADTVEPMALDIVRRAEALAERERGE